MTLFLLGCAAMLLLSAVFYLRPGSRREDLDLEQANLEAYRLRQQELAAEGADDLAQDAQLRLLEDDQTTGNANQGGDAGGRFPAWMVLVAVAAFSTVVYFQLGAMQDVVISNELKGLDEDSTPDQMQALIHAIEQRAGQRPDNLHYRALLGRYYMGQQDYAQAAAVYDELALAAPQDAQAFAYAAQAQYLASGRDLSDKARMRAEQALAIDPHNRTALGLLGMASYEQGKYRAAVEYWERLIAAEPPGSETAQLIGGIINQAREKLGEAPLVAEPAVVTGPGVTVSVVAPAGADISPNDTVFVLARNAELDTRMPIAVQRLRGDQLPLQLRLDDSNSMAGQKLSDTASVVVVVQVSPSGQPGEANASWIGQAGPLAPSESSEPVEISLVPRA